MSDQMLLHPDAYLIQKKPFIIYYRRPSQWILTYLVLGLECSFPILKAFYESAGQTWQNYGRMI